LLGSEYYAKHPVVPIEQTVADINLELVGRTDDTEGSQVGTASITGFRLCQHRGDSPGDRPAGRDQGLQERNSDRFLGASDNYALAELGVSAHSLCVAFLYPDYQKVSDHWEKIDFGNMAKVDRMVALGVLRVANDVQPPRWNDSNPKAVRFMEAA